MKPGTITKVELEARQAPSVSPASHGDILPSPMAKADASSFIFCPPRQASQAVSTAYASSRVAIRVVDSIRHLDVAAQHT